MTGLPPLHKMGLDLADGLSIQERLHIIQPIRRRMAEHLAHNRMIRLDEAQALERLLILGLLRCAQEVPGSLVDLDLTGPGAFEVSSPMPLEER